MLGLEVEERKYIFVLGLFFEVGWILLFRIVNKDYGEFVF